HAADRREAAGDGRPAARRHHRARLGAEPLPGPRSRFRLLSMKAALNLLTRHWPLVALIVSAAMLATAHIFEKMGYAPCTLCLRQREAYWAGMGTAILALAFAGGRGAKGAWAFDALLALTSLYGEGLAFYHSGVEWKWWPGPAECATTGATATAAGL